MTTRKKTSPPPPIDECLYGAKNDDSNTVSLSNLRRIASQGIIDQGSHRSVAWRVLLGYLPEDRSQWTTVLDEKRSLYNDLVHQVFSSPKDNGKELMGHHGKQHSQLLEQQKKESLRLEAQRAIDDVVSGMKPLGLTSLNDSNDRVKSGTIAVSTADTDAQNEYEEPATISSTQNEHEDLVPSPVTKDGTVECVPLRIREQWKKSGRDSSVLVEMSNATGRNVHGVNTLLVVDNNGKAVSDDDTTDDDDNDGDKWVVFFENASLLDEIRKDVVRTHPDLKFFLEPSQNLGHRRYAAMERILFVWAKLNKGVRYVQGMNEIVGTLYFVLANDFNEEWACHAEADTYFLFHTIMAEMSDVFVAAMDNHDTGIQGRISNMNSLLSLHDPEVASHLEEVGIHASFYAIRWLTTLLSREFLLPDTIRLWDSMFASTHQDNFLRYVCVTMVMLIRDDLLKGDFSSCLRLLQSYPPTNLDALLESSRALWIYESQITLACHKGGMRLSQALCTISPPPSVVMAYGLVGGVAIRRVTSSGGGNGGVKESKSSDSTDATTAASSTAASASQQGRAFLTGAKDYLSGLGQQAARNYQSRRANDASSQNASNTGAGNNNGNETSSS